MNQLLLSEKYGYGLFTLILLWKCLENLESSVSFNWGLTRLGWRLFSMVLNIQPDLLLTRTEAKSSGKEKRDKAKICWNLFWFCDPDTSREITNVCCMLHLAFYRRAEPQMTPEHPFAGLETFSESIRSQDVPTDGLVFKHRALQRVKISVYEWATSIVSTRKKY